MPLEIHIGNYLDYILDYSIFYDVDGDTLTLDVKYNSGSLPDWLKFTKTDLRLYGTYAKSTEVNYTLEVIGDDGFFTCTAYLQLNLVNNAPTATIYTITDSVYTEASTFDFLIDAEDELEIDLPYESTDFGVKLDFEDADDDALSYTC